jgi:hypothetical protein
VCLFAVGGSRLSLFGWPLLIIMAAAFAVVFPFFFLGIPSGHDFEFHVNSWMEVVGQWRHGLVYPGWAGLAHYGYGEARFIFYPPISWTLGATLGALLPWKVVPGTYIWIALTLSGCSMFSLARTWLNRRDALFAACFYAANPYYFVIIYWRSAFAELLAGALLPVLLLLVIRLTEERGRVVIPLAFIVAAAWLTDVPAAIMVSYSLVLLVVALAVERRSPRVVPNGALAVALGAALAAVYLVPAIYEQKWVNLAQVLSTGLRPGENFLFTKISDADHNRFNYLVSWVALSEVVVLAVAVVVSRKRQDLKSLWRYLTLWSLPCALLMLPLTSVAWKCLPELEFIQLPWRWLLCLNVPLAILIAVAWRRWAARILICAGLLLVLVFVWHRVQPPWWDRTADIAEMLDNQQTGHGYEGTDEYVPAGDDPYELAQDGPAATVEGASPLAIRIQQWTAESKLFTVQTSHPDKILLRLLNYPAWRMEINGRVVRTETRDVTGQMIIPIQPGLDTVRITFATTRDRKIGMLISSFALLSMATVVWLLRSRPTGTNHAAAALFSTYG